MSRDADYSDQKRRFAAQLKDFEKENDGEGLPGGNEFEQKLRELLDEYGYGLEDVIHMLYA